MLCYGNKDTYNLDHVINNGFKAKIYSIENKPNLVAKIFKKNYNTDFQRTKIKSLLSSNIHPNSFESIKWPLDIILDNNNQFVGYIMEKLNTSTQLYELTKSANSKFDSIKKLIFAHNLCSAVHLVHSNGHLIGDMNPRNIYLNQQNMQVYITNTDSFVINTDEETYRCTAATEGFVPRELYKKVMQSEMNLSTFPLPTYTVETDNFALAVNIFMILMNSYHPFSCSKSEGATDSFIFPSKTDNILDGFSAFLSTKDGMDIPPNAPDFLALPKSIQEMFKLAFVDGHSDPSKRPSAEEWRQVLYNEYLKAKNSKIN